MLYHILLQWSHILPASLLVVMFHQLPNGNNMMDKLWSNYHAVRAKRTTAFNRLMSYRMWSSWIYVEHLCFIYLLLIFAFPPLWRREKEGRAGDVYTTGTKHVGMKEIKQVWDYGKSEGEAILVQCVPINGITFLLGRTVSHLQRREPASRASLPPYCPAGANKAALTAGCAH